MARGKKTGGRKRGTPNKATKATIEIKEKIVSLLHEYSEEQMIGDLKELKPLDRLKMFTSLVEYIVPKQNRTTLEQKGEAMNQVVLYLPENNR